MLNIINLGVLAHVDAGKTTVTEGLLVHCGVKKQMGRVDHGTTTTDSMALERQRGMTIRASTVSFTYHDTKINLLDTPGHMDFIAEVERSLTVLDGVVLVVSAKEGVQPQTRVIFRKLQAMGIPTLFFINKVDRMGVDIDQTLADIRERMTPHIAVMQSAQDAGTRDVAIEACSLSGGALHEAIIEQDDRLMEAYLAGDAITEGECLAALQRATAQGRLYPVYMGAALHDIGVTPLLDAIVTLLRPTVSDTDTLSALVYKVEWDARGHKRLYTRLFSGSLAYRGKAALAAQGEEVYIRSLFTVEDGQLVPTGCVQAGDLAVLMDAPEVHCGDWLGQVTPRKGLASAAPPLLSVGIMPDDPARRPALLSALQRLTEEDPFLGMSIHPDTGEISIRLYGALQREIIEALLVERFALTAQFSPLITRFAAQPQRGETVAAMRIWSPGNLHEAGIVLSVSPMPAGSGNSYVTEVSFGDLEKPFQNAVEAGVLRALREAFEDEIVDTRVTFLDMDYSSVTSTPADFRRLAPLVVAKALAEAGLTRLEPWMRYTLSAPQELHKRVLSALMNLRATMDDVLYEGEEVVIRGEVPLDTSKGFAADLQSITQGKGIFQSEFLAYRKINL